MGECDKHGIASYCNGRNVLTVQLRSQTAGGQGKTNEYRGAVVKMCAECRRSNLGMFKIVR